MLEKQFERQFINDYSLGLLIPYIYYSFYYTLHARYVQRFRSPSNVTVVVWYSNLSIYHIINFLHRQYFREARYRYNITSTDK